MTQEGYKFIMPDGSVKDGYPVNNYTFIDVEGGAYMPVEYLEGAVRLKCVGNWKGMTLELNDEGVEVLRMYPPFYQVRGDE